jgi:hypothetical protein
MRQIIGKFGHNAHSDEIREMLGLGHKAKLPVEGLHGQTIQGVRVWITALPDRPKGGHKRSTHRVLAMCPSCLRVVSAGRLHQHKCKS